MGLASIMLALRNMPQPISGDMFVSTFAAATKASPGTWGAIHQFLRNILKSDS
jgi:hypothetical protein